MIPKIPRHELLSYPLEPYQAFWSSGAPTRLWRRSAVPRIDETTLECVAYLYESEEDAKLGRKSGGCGFWLGVEPSDDLQNLMWHSYFVTAAHVVRGGCLAIRVNTRGGDIDIVETRLESWHFHPDGDDIAICGIDLDLLRQKARMMPASMLLTHQDIKDVNVGPGDDVVVLSRFMSHDGRQTNTPSVRYGNIAMMPQEPIQHPTGLLVESFLVESRSLGGASGSPVLLFLPATDRLFGRGGEQHKNTAFWLLGVNWGHLNLNDQYFERVVDQTGKPHPDSWRVRVNTGIMAVAPAWKIRDIIDLPELAARRLDDEEAYRKDRIEFAAQLDREGVPEEVKNHLLGLHLKKS
jgi:hypothetical protein